MALTLFDLKALTEDKDKLRDFIIHHNLFIDFSGINCVFCSGSIVRSKDSSRKTGFVWRCNSRNFEGASKRGSKRKGLQTVTNAKKRKL